MGYGFKSYLDALAILTRVKGEKIMAKKADKVREALLKGASPHQLAHVTVLRAQREYPKTWRMAAIHQLAQILKIDLRTSQILISEMTTEQIHGNTRPNPNT